MWYIAGRKNPYKAWIARSTDMTSWESFEGHPSASSVEDIQAATYDSQDDIIAFGSGVTLLYKLTDDDGLLNPGGDVVGLTGSTVRSLGYGDGYVFAGMNNGHIYYNSNALADFSWVHSSGAAVASSGITSVCWVPTSGGWLAANVAVGATPGKVRHTTTNFDTWALSTVASPYTGGGFLAYDEDNAVVVLAAGSGEIYTSSDDGVTFSHVATLTGSPSIQGVLHASGVTVVTTTRGIFYSTDNVTWSANVVPEDPFTAGVVLGLTYNGSQFMALAVGSASVYRSNDGMSWDIPYTFVSDPNFPTLQSGAATPGALGHGFFRYPLYWDQISGEARR